MKENKVIETQTSLVEAYLLEYCEVNSVKESELHNKLHILVRNNAIYVISAQNKNRTEFGIRQTTEGGLSVFGIFLLERDKYPKVNKMINELS